MMQHGMLKGRVAIQRNGHVREKEQVQLVRHEEHDDVYGRRFEDEARQHAEVWEAEVDDCLKDATLY